MYFGELLNPGVVRLLNRALFGVGGVLLITAGTMGLGILFAEMKVNGMKAEVAEKSKAIVAAQLEAKASSQKGDRKPPSGLAAVNAFQDRLNRLARRNGCLVPQFQGSDQLNPFVSTFATGAGSSSAWSQIEVRMTLQGSTQAVVQTLSDMHGIGIPYEFTSLEFSRMTVSEKGEATISANASLRVLTLPGAS